MAKSPRSPFDNNPLRRRLAALRRRLFFVSAVRGGGWMLAFLLLGALAAGAMDWAWRLPALARAVALAGLLGGAGVLAYRGLVRPLAARKDDLSLALRIEERYPSLNDALASTIQFLEQAEKKSVQGESGTGARESLAMRREAARRAMKKAEGCDFDRIIDARGLRVAGATAFVAAAAVAAFFFLFPSLAWTAFARLATPFGTKAWPTATTLVVQPPKDRIGREDAFEVRGTVAGVIPEKVVLVVRQDSAAPIELEFRVVQEDDGHAGTFRAVVRPGTLTRDFSFHVVANDAESRQYEVEVAPSPTLAPYEGQASPQVVLFPPSYTERPSRALPPGAGMIDDVAGTVVVLQAAANVRLRAAWLEYHPEPSTVGHAVLFAPLASGLPVGAAASFAVGFEIAGRHPAELSEDRRSFRLRFQPRVSGTYSLVFEDETGLPGQRSYELRVRPDPSPTVVLERPHPLRESFDVLPSARLPLRVVAEDPVFGLRSVWVDYRCAPDEAYQRLMLFAPHLSARRPAIQALAGAALPVAAARLKTAQHVAEGVLPLGILKHEDGSSLREGDVVAIRACADDYDDVYSGKPVGMSSEIELRIVSRPSLDAVLDKEQARIQQELRELRQLEREAARKVAEIENRVSRTKKLSLDDQAELTRLEQEQRQIRERLEAPGQDSVKGRVERILESLRENGVERSATEQRLEVLERELGRLGREQLPQIESALTSTRKQAEQNEETGRENAAKALEQEAERAEKQAKALERLAAQPQRAEPERARLQEEAKALARQAARLRELAREARQEPAGRTPQSDERDKVRARELEALAQEREQLGRDLAKEAKQVPGAEREMLKFADEQPASARALRDQAQALQERAGREKPDLKASLADARRRQEDVEKSLAELLKHMEPWSSTREVKNEAAALLDAQRRLMDELEAMKRQGMRGKEREELTEPEKARLDNATQAQQKLGERMQELADKMGRLAKEKQASDPAAAKELREALEEIDKGSIRARMKAAREQLEQNQLENAGKEQQRAAQELQDLVKKMEDRRDAALDRQRKEIREAEKRLDELADEQDRIRKKIKEAEKIADPKEREEELKRLARDQKALLDKTREEAAHLSRLRAERASQTLGQAAKQMEEALKRLERGEPPGEAQDEALDRLEEAREDAENARQAAEEELAREQLARVADTLARLKERHDRLVDETERLKKEALEQAGWGRGILISLRALAQAQKGLGEESRGLAERELANAEVFARQLRRAADAMREAAEAFDEHFEKVKGKAGDASPPLSAEESQRQAQRRLQSLLDALKMQPGESARAGGANREPPKSGGAAGDGIPPLAQLKLLRAMQAEVKEQTADFGKKNPDPLKHTEAQKKQIADLHREQKAIADLIEEYTRSAPDEGGMK